MRLLASIVLFIYASCMSATPSHGHVELQLTKVVRGECPKVLDNAPVVVDYDFDFDRNMGLAYFLQLKSTAMKQTLNPLGLSDYYAFMSSMRPTPVKVDKEEVIVYRIIFHIYKNGGKKVMLMLGQNGECIVSSS